MTFSGFLRSLTVHQFGSNMNGSDLSHIEEERVAEAFDRLDGDESGYISTQDLRDFLGKDVSMERIDELINDADVDHDGQSKWYTWRGNSDVYDQLNVCLLALPQFHIRSF